MSYIFHPDAATEHLESVAFYETKRAGLGAFYLGEFEAAMSIICRYPHRNPVEEKPDIRRVRLKSFPYIILYRESNSSVQVLAVAHKRRNPKYWQDRI